ncbi:MAG: histidine kinase [Bacillota bacterium]|nr:histidine kinase [Bacillota bacterium]
MDNLDQKIAELIRKIDDVKKRWPMHSAKPSMLRELEDLELELENLEGQKRKQDSSKN